MEREWVFFQYCTIKGSLWNREWILGRPDNWFTWAFQEVKPCFYFLKETLTKQLTCALNLGISGGLWNDLKRFFLFSLKPDIFISRFDFGDTNQKLYSCLISNIVMNSWMLSLISILLFQSSSSKGSLFPILKMGLDSLDHLVNSRNSISSILFPEPIEAKNITIKLGFIGALDKSLGATSSLGRELVSFIEILFLVVKNFLTNS